MKAVEVDVNQQPRREYMRFIISDGMEKKVTMEQAEGDVIVRVDGQAVVAFRGAEPIMGISLTSLKEIGLSYRIE